MPLQGPSRHAALETVWMAEGRGMIISLSNDCGGSVKYKEIYLYAYYSVTAAKEGLTRYFQFYNSRGLHSSLAGQTPDQMYFQQQPQPYAA